jgi:hypothetical protein
LIEEGVNEPRKVKDQMIRVAARVSADVTQNEQPSYDLHD